MEKARTELVIIGAGPAGLGAAIYAARSAIDFIVIEKFMSGGQIVTTESIENYPGFKGEVSGFDLMQNILEHCRDFDIKIEESMNINSVEIIKNNTAKKKHKFLCRGDNNSINADALIIATGASPKRLFVNGENEFIGKGISFCATCDGALYRDREVMVIGGGNTAIQEALFLVKFAKKVYIVHRRDELRAVKSLQNKAFEDKKIEMLLDTVVEEFYGTERLEKIRLKNVKTGKENIMQIDGVFEYVGIQPNNETVKDIVEIDRDGFIITNSKMETSIEGIYAAGDVRNTPLRQVITAVADGAIAATFADKYINDLY